MRPAITTSPHARYIVPAAVPRPHPQHQAPAHPRYDARQALPFFVAHAVFVDPAGAAATFSGVTTISVLRARLRASHLGCATPPMRPFPIAYTAFFASRRSPNYHLHHYPRAQRSRSLFFITGPALRRLCVAPPLPRATIDAGALPHV
jgi:hypothetical protein